MGAFTVEFIRVECPQAHGRTLQFLWTFRVGKVKALPFFPINFCAPRQSFYSKCKLAQLQLHEAKPKLKKLSKIFFFVT